VLRKRVAVLVAAAMMVLSMLVVSAPAFAQGVGGCDSNPGRSEGSRSHVATPPPVEPGGTVRHPTANEHDTSDPRTGRGKRNEPQEFLPPLSEGCQ
jgi:hypothetical protein